jgi:hypothetical protein
VDGNAASVAVVPTEAGAMHAALALAVALAGRTEGQHIDVSLSESITAWCSLFTLPLMDIEDPLDAGLVQGDNDVFETADGRLLSLATFEDKFWLRFRTELADDFPALDTTAYDRRAHRTAAGRKSTACCARSSRPGTFPGGSSGSAPSTRPGHRCSPVPASSSTTRKSSPAISSPHPLGPAPTPRPASR